MAAAFCAHCGRPLVPNAAFCSSCGAPVAGTLPPSAPAASPSPTFPSGASYYAPYAPTYPGQGGLPPAFGPGDQVALLYVSWAAILALVGALISVVALVFVSGFSFLNVSTTGTGSTSVSVNSTGFAWVVALTAVGAALTMAELFLYRRAFVVLRNRDHSFSTPATLVFLALAALAVVFLVLFGLLGLIAQAITCAGPGNTITSSCLDAGTFFGLFAVLAVTAIVAVVGYIGLLIGIWRLGTRYSESMFKAGAILLIFPVVNIVGVVLILVAARSAGGRLQGTTSPMPFGL